MSAKIGEWLHRDPQPTDVYALLGRPRFDPDRQQLLEDIRFAYSELLPYQNHVDPEMVRRAVRLQMELGRAEAILNSVEKLRAHHIQLVEDLRAAYTTAKGEGAADWSPEQLVSWLGEGQLVHPSRLEIVARLVSRSGERALESDLQELLEFGPLVRTEEPQPSEERKPAPGESKATRVFCPQPLGSAPVIESVTASETPPLPPPLPPPVPVSREESEEKLDEPPEETQPYPSVGIPHWIGRARNRIRSSPTFQRLRFRSRLYLLRWNNRRKQSPARFWSAVSAIAVVFALFLAGAYLLVHRTSGSAQRTQAAKMDGLAAAKVAPATPVKPPPPPLPTKPDPSGRAPQGVLSGMPPGVPPVGPSAQPSPTGSGAASDPYPTSEPRDESSAGSPASLGHSTPKTRPPRSASREESIRLGPGKVFKLTASDDDIKEFENAKNAIKVRHNQLFSVAFVHYREKRLHGLAEVFYEDQKKRQVGHYSDGKRHGPLRLWDPGGNRRYWGEYSDGLRHGFCCRFENDQPVAIAEYAQDVLQTLFLIRDREVRKRYAGTELAAANAEATKELNDIDSTEVELKRVDDALRRGVRSWIEDQQEAVRKSRVQQLSPDRLNRMLQGIQDRGGAQKDRARTLLKKGLGR